MTNVNCLAGLACPNCGHDSSLHITGSALFKVTDDGTDLPIGDIEWDDGSPTFCPACPYEGPLAAYRLDRKLSPHPFRPREGTSSHLGPDTAFIGWERGTTAHLEGPAPGAVPSPGVPPMSEHAAAPNGTIAVDFDGVLHSYTSPWVSADVIPDPPVPGAIEWLNEITKRLTVVILTTRGGHDGIGIYPVIKWLRDNGYTGPDLLVTDTKVKALVYLDDRAMRFDGSNFPTAEDVHRARPWNKRSTPRTPA